MKIGAISGDMAVKLGLGAVAVLALAYVAYKATNAASAATEWASTHLDPTDPNNVAYSTVNTWGGAVVTDPTGPGKNADGSWTLGGWLYDVTHPSTTAAIANLSNP
jgi:hypothetical protein